MTDAADSTLSPLARLALAYAPPAAHAAWSDLLELDARLARIVRGAREPVLAQIRLAWWRERLAEAPDARPRGEPLLARLGAWPDGGAGLAPLVDGWEAMLDDAGEAGDAFAAGRAAAMAALSGSLGLASSGEAHARTWALAEWALATGNAMPEADRGPRLSAALRPLAVLAAVTARAARKRDPQALTSPLALLTALRHGLLRR